MVNQELADQRFPFFQNQLDGFCSLDQSDLPGHNSQDTCFVSAGHQTRRGRFRKEAAQTRPSLFWKKDAGLSFKLENASLNIRLPGKERSVVHQILRRKVIRPINDDIVPLKNLESILRS